MLPSTEELLRQFGDRLRLARQRRRLSAKQVAERAGMSPMTLRSLERGSSGVTMGAYLSVMQVLGIEDDLGQLGKADPQGRELQDARLPARSSQAKRTHPIRDDALPSAQRNAAADKPQAPSKAIKKPLKPTENVPSWREQNGFTDSETLAGLIHPPAPLPTRRR
ncbi:helix-turn-helix transcriptional regulator [Aquabacterium sp.]|uniref:helix-turn-helix domain-containing protein n=1 Tax=Aquabacterium sp. TaxID=1872578 RepID=UPI0025BC694D|nr:helix-turn-helix transcriptional regulator [Aquabacterium sp.]